jgi:hypothetical protein
MSTDILGVLPKVGFDIGAYEYYDIPVTMTSDSTAMATTIMRLLLLYSSILEVGPVA